MIIHELFSGLHFFMAVRFILCFGLVGLRNRMTAQVVRQRNFLTGGVLYNHIEII